MSDIKLPELPEELRNAISLYGNACEKADFRLCLHLRCALTDKIQEYALSAIKAQSLQGVSDFGQLQSALEEIDRLKVELPAVRENADVNAEDAKRYRRLRILGCAPMDTKHLKNGLVMRFTNLDSFLDQDISLHASRGEFNAVPDSEGKSDER